MSLGQNIYRLRTERKLSQEDFASEMEVSRQSVSKWENDSAVPELEKLMKMSQLFQVSLDELVGNTPPQPKLEPAPAPVPTPAPAAGVTSGDLVSVVLLILGIILPIATIFTISLLQSWLVLVIGLYIVPAAVTFGAAYCSPNNKLLMRIYLIYDIIMCIIGVLFMSGALQFAMFTCLPTLGAYCFWSARSDD